MIIITGGAGFIGSNILEGLEREGYKKLVVCDYMGSDSRWKSIAKRELFDIVNPENLAEYCNAHAAEIDAVIHMGAISTTTETDVELITNSNIRLTWALWEFCAANKKRFIYASSAATYGSGENGFEDREDQQYLNALRPLNAYGWSKAFIDRKVARYLSEGGIAPAQHVGLKFFNVYGPNEYHKGGQKSVIAHIFPSAKKGEAVKLFKSYNPAYKDGGQLRDFVWVGDIVSVVLWLLKNPSVNGLFNVGSGQARSFEDLAVSTFAALGLEPKIEYIEMPEMLRGKYQYYTKANLQKLRAAGYDKPTTRLEDGVREYVKNFLDCEDQYL